MPVRTCPTGHVGSKSSDDSYLWDCGTPGPRSGSRWRRLTSYYACWSPFHAMSMREHSVQRGAAAPEHEHSLGPTRRSRTHATWTRGERRCRTVIAAARSSRRWYCANVDSCGSEAGDLRLKNESRRATLRMHATTPATRSHRPRLRPAAPSECSSPPRPRSQTDRRGPASSSATRRG